MMSSQAERIRAFKHAQHARLQKQDEEGWISSEELCTEGSSDEETHTNIKRKPKRTQPTEKRGISPLAQPPKIFEMESTSTYQQDSQYLLPDPQMVMHGSETSEIDNKVKQTDLSLTSSYQIQPDLSKSQMSVGSNTSSSSIEDVNDEALWRPKRGSIKLPEFPEGMTAELASLRNN